MAATALHPGLDGPRIACKSAGSPMTPAGRSVIPPVPYFRTDGSPVPEGEPSTIVCFWLATEEPLLCWIAPRRNCRTTSAGLYFGDNFLLGFAPNLSGFLSLSKCFFGEDIRCRDPAQKDPSTIFWTPPRLSLSLCLYLSHLEGFGPGRSPVFIPPGFPLTPALDLGPERLCPAVPAGRCLLRNWSQ